MCGIVGITSQQPVSTQLYDSLIHLQHRGQDAAGILTCDQRIHCVLGQGLVREVFNEDNIYSLKGNFGVGHVRYPTSGGYSEEEVQPFIALSPYGIGLVHNGNLINDRELASQLQTHRMRHLNTQSDSEVLLNLFADGLMTPSPLPSTQAFFQQICHSVQMIFNQVYGAYAVICSIVGKGLVAFRDPHGIRPLVMGRRTVDGHTDTIFASETTMFYPLGFEHAGNVAAGEVIFVDLEGNIHRQQLTNQKFTPCVFEYVYFARPDAKLDDVSVYRARLRIGQNLAKRWLELHPEVQPDVVIPAPYTSNTAALAFANQLGVRYSEGLYKNPFIGRTFIMPNRQERKRSIRYKLIPQDTEIRNKHVLILDDSIVRGTTSREIVKMVREHGAKSVYFVSACPPVKFPCFYGIDIPSRQELIAATMTETESQNFLQVDILMYQTIPALEEAVTRRGEHHIDTPCMACLNGKYISGNIDEARMEQLEQKRCQTSANSKTV